MDAALGMFLDSITEHWPDLAVAALFAFAVWLLQRWISAGDRRDQILEEEQKRHGNTIHDHETRITVIEKTPGKRGQQ